MAAPDDVRRLRFDVVIRLPVSKVERISRNFGTGIGVAIGIGIEMSIDSDPDADRD